MSPGETAATLTTVPAAGANSRVSFRAFSALRTVASAPSTAACAEAMLAAMVSALVVLVCPDPEPPLPERDPPLEPPPPEPPEPPEPLDALEPLEPLEPLLDDPEDPLPVAPCESGSSAWVLRWWSAWSWCWASSGWSWSAWWSTSPDGRRRTRSTPGCVSRLVLVDDPDARRGGLVLGVGQVVLGRGQVGLRLLHRQLGRGGVEGREQLPLGDVVAVLDVEVLQRPARLEVGLRRRSPARGSRCR